MERRRFLGTMLGLAVAAKVLPFWQGREGSIELYDVNGQSIFPVMADDGGLSADVRSFLIAARNGRLFSYSFDPRMTKEEDAKNIFEAQMRQAVFSGDYVMLPATHEKFEIAA